MSSAALLPFLNLFLSPPAASLDAVTLEQLTAVLHALDAAKFPHAQPLELVLGVMLESPDKAQYIGRIQERLDVAQQAALKSVLQALLEEKPPSSSSSSSQPLVQLAYDSLMLEKNQLADEVRALEARLAAAERDAAAAKQRRRDDDDDGGGGGAHADDSLLADAAASSSSVAALTAERDHLASQLAESAAALTRAEAASEATARAERRVRELADRVDLLEEQLAAAQKTAASARRYQKRLEEMPALRERVRELEEQVAASMRRATAAEAGAARGGGARAQIDAYKSEVARLRSDASAHAVALAAKEDAARAAQLEIDSLTAALAHAREEARALRRQRDEEAEAAAANSGASLVDELAAAATTTPAASPAAASDVASLTAEKTRLEGYLRTAKAMIRELRDKKKEEVEARVAEVRKAHELTIGELRRALAAAEADAKAQARLLAEAREAAAREQELILSALYDAGMDIQRERTPSTLLASKKGGRGAQSFLARQRELMLRRLR